MDQQNDTAGVELTPAVGEGQDKQDRLPFDKAAISTMRATALNVIAAHAEVRSVIVVIDYAGELNEANVDKGLWVGEDGAVTKIDAIHGSIGNTVAVLEQLFLRAAQHAQNMREQVMVLGKEIIKRKAELNGIETTEKPTTPKYRRPVGWPEHFWYDYIRGEIREGPNAIAVIASMCVQQHVGLDHVVTRPHIWRHVGRQMAHAGVEHKLPPVRVVTPSAFARS